MMNENHYRAYANRQIPKLVVVYGGQWGSEAKGSVLSAIVRDDRGAYERAGYSLPWAAYAVRVGGPNAGHTARFPDGKLHAVQSLPLPSFQHPDRIYPVIGAGGLVNLHVLEREIKLRSEMAAVLGVRPTVIRIDKKAAIIDHRHELAESDGSWNIGSTREGVGAALRAKIARDGSCNVAEDLTNELKELGVQVTDTVEMLNQSRVPVYVEGTQGYLLSLHTSGYYPYTTSRQCGPIGILADIGLSPFAAEDYQAIGVFRTFPIRVGGNSGEMGEELTWEELSEMTGGYIQPEFTTVTKKQRRIAKWDEVRALRTIAETRPTSIAITFLDYLFPELGKGWNVNNHELNYQVHQWLAKKSLSLGTKISYFSHAPGQENCHHWVGGLV